MRKNMVTNYGSGMIIPDPDPTWAKSSGSDRIRVQNIERTRRKRKEDEQQLLQPREGKLSRGVFLPLPQNISNMDQSEKRDKGELIHGIGVVDPDPYVFGPPGSGSSSKNCIKKTLILTVFMTSL
jgi:hypothetical protein